MNVTMNDESTHATEIYQLRAYIRQISPLIWRRILVRSDSTIADLHYILQIAFGWSDTYLHQFIIRGKSYGIAYIGGITFLDNPHKMRLKDLSLRLKERFVYEYNFFVHWEIEVRLEKMLPSDPRKTYPICSDGDRPAPPEDCEGPAGFMNFQQGPSFFDVIETEQRLIEIVKDKELTDEEKVEDIREAIDPLSPWLNIRKFNRRTINQWLKRYAVKEKGWEEAFEEV